MRLTEQRLKTIIDQSDHIIAHCQDSRILPLSTLTVYVESLAAAVKTLTESHIPMDKGKALEGVAPLMTTQNKSSEGTKEEGK